MSEKRNSRARGAKVMQETMRPNARIRDEKAKEIIAGRTAEAAAREAENRAKREKRVANFHRRAHADADDEWIPASEIFCGVKE